MMIAKRGTTIQPVRYLTKWEKRAGEEIEHPGNDDRPKTRGDCEDGPRPCPWVSCKYNNYLDVNDVTGAVKLNHPDLEPDQMVNSCALDVADEGGVTLERVAEALNITRERVRQVEVHALVRIRLTPAAMRKVF